MTLKMIDLFCGAGGLSLGFEKEGFRTVAATDNWKDALDTFSLNRKGKKVSVIHGDIRDPEVKKEVIKIGKAEKVDVIVGGPPCQGFSNAGNRDPKDPRNSLFMEFVEVVKEVRPKVFLMENVKGMLSMKNQKGERVFDIILSEFGKLGYKISYKPVDTSKYGVPQRRHRIFIIGCRDGREFDFPKEGAKPKTIGETIKGIRMDTPNNIPQKLSPQTEYMVRMIPEGGSWKNVPYEKLPPRLKRIRDNIKRYKSPNFYRRFSMKDVAGTVTASATPENSGIIHPKEDRRMTPRECARIQTFPDDYVFSGNIPQQYRQIGNAVPPMMAGIIAAQMKRFLSSR